MRILITNHRLALRTGTELFAGELAHSLRKRGHEIALFSPQCGELAEELRGDGLTVSDDLAGLELQPDIIHGQHHLATMSALAALPGCPAIYLCHGYAPWEEWPPLHPRIACYAAVSGKFRKWFEKEHGIAPELFELVLGGIDLERFQEVRETPRELSSAIVFDNNMARGRDFQIIAEACSARGISVGGVGRGFGRVVDDPAKALLETDLVFASGRSAMEAIACGCAVILLRDGESGCLVTADSLEHQRDRNFALGSSGVAVDAASLGAEIDRYSAPDTTETTRRLRLGADQELVTERLLTLYQRAIDKRPAASPQAELACLAAYLQKIAGHVTQADEKFAQLRAGWEKTKRKRVRLRQELEVEKHTVAALGRYFQRGPLRRRLWRAALEAMRRER